MTQLQNISPKYAKTFRQIPQLVTDNDITLNQHKCNKKSTIDKFTF